MKWKKSEAEEVCKIFEKNFAVSGYMYSTRKVFVALISLAVRRKQPIAFVLPYASSREGPEHSVLRGLVALLLGRLA